ncbi:MAG: phage tail protein [Candidatus Thiodiazotropha taylori]|uniref:Phage tail protein n=1 Tax=Candidatus Thiodiazotropha taylori TaxID=2792791 RepID=A0A9E4K9M4_9GAMM|nr:phage tail protein [Candidatus Thiodiazotropha taylori]MCW4255063.1 phage tail protein [Candidatus Thiodiazotropha taylori]
MKPQVELSYVAPQNFFMVVEQLPEVVFTVQQVTIPSLDMDTVNISAPSNPSKTFIPGEGATYAELNVTFLLDKHLTNYRSILKWLKANADPEGDRIGDDWNDYGPETLSQNYAYSNITLVATDAGQRPLAHWNFVNAFPVSLDGPNYDATMPDIEYLQANVSFNYHYFKFETYTNGGTDGNEI